MGYVKKWQNPKNRGGGVKTVSQQGLMSYIKIILIMV